MQWVRAHGGQSLRRHPLRTQMFYQPVVISSLLRRIGNCGRKTLYVSHPRSHSGGPIGRCRRGLDQQTSSTSAWMDGYTYLTRRSCSSCSILTDPTYVRKTDGRSILHLGRIGDPDVIIVSVLVLRTQSHASICTSDRLVQLTAGLATNLKTSRGHRVVRNVVPLYSVSL